MLERVHHKHKTAMMNQHTALIPLIEGWAPTQDRVPNQSIPAGNVLFAMHKSRDPQMQQLGGFFLPHLPGLEVDMGHGLRVESIDMLRKQHLLADLTLKTVEACGKLHCAFQYRRALFEQSAVEQMARHYIQILRALVGNPCVPVQRIPLLDHTEQHQLIVEFNSLEKKHEPVTLVPSPLLFRTAPLSEQHKLLFPQLLGSFPRGAACTGGVGRSHGGLAPSCL